MGENWALVLHGASGEDMTLSLLTETQAGTDSGTWSMLVS